MADDYPQPGPNVFSADQERQMRWNKRLHVELDRGVALNLLAAGVWFWARC
jgi:hypothetical protein